MATEYINGPMVIVFYISCRCRPSVQRLATIWTVRGSNPGGSEVFRIVQNGHWPHTASCTVATGLFLRAKRPGRDIDLSPPLAPRLKKEYSYTFTPLYPVPSPRTFIANYMVKFLYFHLSRYDYFAYEIYKHFHDSAKSPKLFRAAVITWLDISILRVT